MVNRCGRGYSFEALRAKILYSAGAHKIDRPKFQRKLVSERFDGFGYEGFPMRTTEMLQRDKNYGTDISTLLKLLEEGRL